MQRSSRQLDHTKKRKLQWYSHVSRSSGLAKTTLQGTGKGGKKTRQTEEEVGRQHREWTGLEFTKSQRAVENRGKWRKLIAKIICGAPTTLAVKG